MRDIRAEGGVIGRDAGTADPDSAALRRAAILLLAARQGLIARDGARIRPLPEAQAFIARHETPEPDFARRIAI